MLTSPAWPPAATRLDRDPLAESAGVAAAGSLRERLDFAEHVGRATPTLRGGTAAEVFAALATIAAVDVALARTVEPHLDALSILEQAGEPRPAGVWGVFAAEAPGMRLRADREALAPETADTDTDPGSADTEPSGPGAATFRLTGRKPWCSLADALDGALVTAEVDGGERRLFAVDLRDERVTVHSEEWVARGLPDVPSGPVDFDGVPARPVGEAGWYVRRPGFAWGGIGVAACWWGGAVGLAQRLQTAAAERPDPWRNLALGESVAALADAEDAVAGAAARIDGDASLDDAGWSAAAHLVRARVRRAVDDVVRVVTSTLGPTPSATDAGYAARVADLELYVLQDHGRKDLARLGELVAGGTRW